MSLKRLIVIMVARRTAGLLGTARHVAAQTSPLGEGEPESLPRRRTRARASRSIRRPLLYRRCVDWYELQYRPSGTVLYPQMHCWWVRGLRRLRHSRGANLEVNPAPRELLRRVRIGLALRDDPA